ncbi:MAG: F0F1 ATP synthase subunit epsilon [Actinomycetales bacterium]
MSSLDVSLVSAHETVWSGAASLVLARTLEGEMAVMAGHTPLLGVLASGEVRITPTDGSQFSAEIDGGFLSVEHDRVLIVAESAELSA